MVKIGQETAGAPTGLVDFKCVWVAGMPRSGSMWAYNVVRRLLDVNQWEIEPDILPLKEHQKDRCFEKAMRNENKRRICVLKTHRKISPDLPMTRFVNTQRDIRDALMSYIRFMRCDFETGLKAAVGMASSCDHYDKFSDRIIHRLKYHDILHQPLQIVDGLGKFLGFSPSAEINHRIVHDLSKKNIQKLIQIKEGDVRCRLECGGKLRETELIRNLDGTYRARDEKTGFQGGHISDYKDGDWMYLLTTDQRREVHLRLGNWLSAHGYPPDPEMLS